MDQRSTWVTRHLAIIKVWIHLSPKHSQRRRGPDSASATWGFRKWRVLWKANVKSMSMDSALKSRRRKCAAPLKSRKSLRMTPVNCYKRSQTFRSRFSWLTSSSNIFEDFRLWTRHSLGFMEKWTFRSFALNEMGSSGLNDYNSTRRRRQLGVHYDENNSRNENKAR